MDSRFMPNVSRKPTILHPDLPAPVFVAVLLTSTCLLVVVVLVFIGVAYYRSRSRGWSEASSTEPCSPVLPFDAAISQSTPDFLENHGINDDSKCDYGSRSTRTVVKQNTLPVMMQRHQSFQRQLSHAISGPESLDPAVPGALSSGAAQAASQPDRVRSTGPGRTAEDRTVGRLHVTLRFDPDSSSLVVRLLRAEDLPPRDFSGTSDPYVRLCLFPDAADRGGGGARHQLTSRLHRKTLNPVFDETFRFPVPSLGALRGGGSVLQMSVFDFDRFSRRDLIGVTVVKNILGEGSAATDPYAEQLYELDLVNAADSTSVGELLISLVYLPMAGRLTLNVIKAKNLGPATMKGRITTSVKTTLMCRGKHIKKKKTSGKPASANLTYNEAMVFDVPYDNIEGVHLIIRVISQDEYDNSEVIGTCAVGRQVLGVGHDHWTEMLANARKPVAQWHRLMELTPSIESLPPFSHSQ